jgi:predicted nucleotidyltransferase
MSQEVGRAVTEPIESNRSGLRALGECYWVQRLALFGSALRQRSWDMRYEQLVKEKREEILRIASRHGARDVRVFGSVARGEADRESDIDFLVELEAGRSLLDLGGMQMELESLLDCRVDVVTVRGLKARIRDRVLREAMPV